MKFAAPRACGIHNSRCSSALNVSGCRSGHWSTILVSLCKSIIELTSGSPVRRSNSAVICFRSRVNLTNQSRSLSACSRIGEHSVREASLHSPRNQPALATFAQILIVRYPDAKLKEPPIKGRRTRINAEFGPYLCKPVSRFTKTDANH